MLKQIDYFNIKLLKMLLLNLSLNSYIYNQISYYVQLGKLEIRINLIHK